MGNNAQMESPAVGRAGSRYEQLLNAQVADCRSANFRARARSTFKFFQTLPEARAWAEHVVRRDFPDISVEEDVGGVWELREIHTAAR